MKIKVQPKHYHDWLDGWIFDAEEQPEIELDDAVVQQYRNAEALYEAAVQAVYNAIDAAERTRSGS